jgi:hypothetical protein
MKMLWTIKFWIRDHWNAFIVKQFQALDFSIRYRVLEKYLREQVEAGDGCYFKCLIESFEKRLDK